MINRIGKELINVYSDRNKKYILLDAFINNKKFYNSLCKKKMISSETQEFIKICEKKIKDVYNEVSVENFRVFKCKEILREYCEEYEKREIKKQEKEKRRQDAILKKQEEEIREREQAEIRKKKIEEDRRIERIKIDKKYKEVKAQNIEVFNVLEQLVRDKIYKKEFISNVSEILFNVYLNIESERNKKTEVIAYCTIETFNGLQQEIVLNENGKYMKLRDGTFCWDIKSELGKKCISSLLKEQQMFECSHFQYKILNKIFINKNFEDKNTIKKIDFRTKSNVNNIGEYSKNCVYVFFKLNNLCSTKGHDVESVTLQASDLIKERDVDINAFYCKNCDFYYMNYEMLKDYIANNIRPKVKFRIVGNSLFEMNVVSELMLYGYTVREGVLSERQRRSILIALIENGLMSKNEIIRNIESKVEFNGRKVGNEIAKKKWEEDIEFISKYTSDNKRVIKGVTMIR